VKIAGKNNTFVYFVYVCILRMPEREGEGRGWCKRETNVLGLSVHFVRVMTS